jgi:hypothetical protein
MQDVSCHGKSGFDLIRKGKLVGASLLMSAILAACGGGGDDSPAAASVSAPTPAPAAASQNSAGGSGLTGVPTSAKGTTTLSWTPPTMNDDGTPLKVTGYRIYWGLSEDFYPHSVTLDNPGLTRYVIEGLKAAKWYFVATALSADGESPPSNVVVMNVL